MRVKLLYYLGWSITRLISRVLFRIRITGQEHIPKTGGFIIASNHVSFYDPPLVGSWSTREMFFFAKAELFRNPLFGALIRRTNALPVKRGTIDRESITTAAGVIDRQFGLVIFPEGTRSLTGQFLEPKPGIGLIARRSPCPIVPAYVHGSNRLADCFLGKTRMSITFGEPISPEWSAAQEDGKAGYLAIAARVMGEIASLSSAI